jgi:hypothetical protein
VCEVVLSKTSGSVVLAGDRAISVSAHVGLNTKVNTCHCFHRLKIGVYTEVDSCEGAGSIKPDPAPLGTTLMD